MKKFDYYAVICLAYLHRWLFPLLVLLELWLFEEELIYVGFTFITFALIDYLAYRHRFRFWYCAYQHAAHSKMTPDKIDWSSVKKEDAVGFSITTALVGVAGIVVYFVVKCFFE